MSVILLSIYKFDCLLFYCDSELGNTCFFILENKYKIQGKQNECTSPLKIFAKKEKTGQQFFLDVFQLPVRDNFGYSN